MDYYKNNLMFIFALLTSSQLDTAEADDIMRVTCHFVSRSIPSNSALIT